MKPYSPKTKTELIAFVDNPNICLGDIDTSLITDMSRLFALLGELLKYPRNEL